eukprot:866510-Prorocentrum_minimum.AAC.1
MGVAGGEAALPCGANWRAIGAGCPPAGSPVGGEPIRSTSIWRCTCKYSHGRPIRRRTRRYIFTADQSGAGRADQCVPRTLVGDCFTFSASYPPLRAYSLLPHAIGPHYGHIPSSLTRLAPGYIDECLAASRGAPTHHEALGD